MIKTRRHANGMTPRWLVSAATKRERSAGSKWTLLANRQHHRTNSFPPTDKNVLDRMKANSIFCTRLQTKSLLVFWYSGQRSSKAGVRSQCKRVGLICEGLLGFPPMSLFTLLSFTLKPLLDYCTLPSSSLWLYRVMIVCTLIMIKMITRSHKKRYNIMYTDNIEVGDSDGDEDVGCIVGCPWWHWTDEHRSHSPCRHWWDVGQLLSRSHNDDIKIHIYIHIYHDYCSWALAVDPSELL